MHRDRSELSRIQQCQYVPADDSLRALAVLGRDLSDAYTRWMSTGVLLKERLAFDTIGVTLEYQWPIVDEGQKYGRDTGVVSHHVALCNSGVFEEDFVEAGYVKRLAATKRKNSIAR